MAVPPCSSSLIYVRSSNSFIDGAALEVQNAGMIVCNRCGGKNTDQALVCRGCGHKLRSRRVTGGATAGGRRKELACMGESRDTAFGRLLGRTLLVWGGAALVLAAVGYGLSGGAWWPVGVASALALGAAAVTRN